MCADWAIHDSEYRRRLCLEAFAYVRKMGCDYVISSCRSDGTELFYMASEWSSAAGYLAESRNHGATGRFSHSRAF